jgi:non-reducing end alpha-L-arabinofuranosidase
MKYEHKIGTVALALAFLGGACSSSSPTSSSSSPGGTTTASSQTGSGSGGSSTSGGQSSVGQSSSSKAGGSAGQSSSGSAGKGGNGGSQSSSTSIGTTCDSTSVTPCGGDVVGSWTVNSGCLNLSGDFETRGTGLGCDTAKLTGSVKVTGSFVATADKKFQDKTTTKGDVTVILDHQCLWMSGTWTQCDLISVAIEGLGFKDIKCVDGPDGSCTCPGKVDNVGNMGLIVADPQDSGDYTTSNNVLGTGDNTLTGKALEYSYCVANGKLTLTPKTSSPAMTGTIVLAKGTGGSGGSGGSGGKGGTTTSGGGTSTSGGTVAGGTSSKGGSTVTGGTTTASGGAVGGTSTTGGTGGGTNPGTGPDLPCDILEKASSPCVGAYGMVRKIYKNYSGALYQVRSKSNTSNTKDVTMLTDGYADIKVQDDFCASGGCTVSKLFDQSPKGNHLVLTPNVCWLSNNGQFGPKCNASSGAVQHESDISKNPKINAGGHSVYGLHTENGQGNCYRVIKGNGTATGEDPEFVYAVMDVTQWTPWCCYDFGNAESTGQPDSYSSMEAIYFGNATMWGKGAGNGPWFSCDYELVISPGGTKVAESIPAITSSLIKKYATFMLKGYKGDHIALKYADAQKAGLTTQWDGARARENAGSAPVMHKQGSIILGSGGDGSFLGKGNFFEGAITAGVSEDKAVDEAIAANVYSVGYKD